jgi:hypothetical protein
VFSFSINIVVIITFVVVIKDVERNLLLLLLALVWAGFDPSTLII